MTDQFLIDYESELPKIDTFQGIKDIERFWLWMKTFSNKIEHEYERLDTHISQVIEKYSVIKDLTKEQKILIKSAINNIKKSFGKNAIKLNDYSFHKARVSVDKKDINIDLKFAVITVTENSWNKQFNLIKEHFTNQQEILESFISKKKR